MTSSIWIKRILFSLKSSRNVNNSHLKSKIVNILISSLDIAPLIYKTTSQSEKYSKHTVHKIKAVSLARNISAYRRSDEQPLRWLLLGSLQPVHDSAAIFIAVPIGPLFESIQIVHKVIRLYVFKFWAPVSRFPNLPGWF